jgi:foldase protein PrsA
MTPAAAQDGSAPAARVNGETISQQDLINRLRADYGSAVLEQLITELLVAQEAKRLRIEVTDVDVDQRIRRQVAQLPPGTTLEQALQKQNPPIGMSTYRELIRMLLRLEKMVEKEVVVTDTEVLNYLKGRPDLTEQTEQVQLEGLVVRDRKLADQLYQEASKRNQDFEKLSRVFSTRDQKVERVPLGWQKVGEVPEIPLNARKGYVSVPVEVTPGTGVYWIYRVVDRQAARRKSLDEARKDARAALLEFKLAEKSGERLEKIRQQNASKIERTLPKSNEQKDEG